MTPEDIRRKKILESAVDLRGDLSNVLPEETLRKICSKWVPELSEIESDGTLFLEHGYPLNSILKFLISELAWGTENNSDSSFDIDSIPEQRKWNLLYTLESLSLCHASNVLTWSVSEGGVVPQLETVPWRTGPERNWYDTDIEPVDPSNIGEKLNRAGMPSYPAHCDVGGDPGLIKETMQDSLCRSTGLTERLSIFHEHLPVRPLNDSGICKWGGVPTFVTPFESDSPSLSSSPLISKIEYPEVKVKTAASMFVSKKKEIQDIYGYMMSSLASYIEEQSLPEQELPPFHKDTRELTPERCRRFASFFRFVEMDMWKNFDYIMQAYRVQDESRYSLGVLNADKPGSFLRMDISESPPKTGQLMLNKYKPDWVLDPSENHKNPGRVIYTEPRNEHEKVELSKENHIYDTITAPVIWEKFNARKKIMIRALAVKTLADVKHQYEDMMAEIAAAEECLAAGSFSDFENIREKHGLLMNERVPTQRFFLVEVFVPLEPSEVKITFSEKAMGMAALNMIRAGREKSEKFVKSVFSKKEQEDHLRGVGTALHSLICMAVDAVEGRSVLGNWSADIYSSIQEHSINDAFLPRNRSIEDSHELAAETRNKLAKLIDPLNFSKIREGVKLSRYGKDIGGTDSQIVTFSEWNQLEQLTPAPGFRPFVERADGLSMRELIRHGVYGTTLQNGLTRDNSRYVLAPRITKWRLRSSIKDISKKITEDAVGENKKFLAAHVDNLRGIEQTRKGIMEFVLSFCDSFAKQAYKTKLDMFNDRATTDALENSDASESRLALLKASSESWGLGGTGLYLRENESTPGDLGLSKQSWQYRKMVSSRREFRTFNIAMKQYTESRQFFNSVIREALLSGYTKEYSDIGHMIGLGYQDHYLYSKKGYSQVFDSLFWERKVGRVLKDNSQYMPLLKVLEYPKNYLTGTYIYNVNFENHDIMHTENFIQVFNNRHNRRFKLDCLPMGREKDNKYQHPYIDQVIDNMLRLAWHGNKALIASRTYRDYMSRDSMGYEAMFDPHYGMRSSNMRLGEVGPKGSAAPVLFIQGRTMEEERSELIDSYTISERTHDIYMDKHRILYYSAYNPKYEFMALYQPVRRFNNCILIDSLEPAPARNSFGYGALSYERKTSAEISGEYGQQIRAGLAYDSSGDNDHYGYHGELPMEPSSFLMREALRQIEKDPVLKKEHDALKEYVFAKEYIVARSGNDREDKNWESARMRCLLRDIGYTVRKMRDKNADLPLTVMSSAAMDPLSRLGEPEILMEPADESIKKAELSSALRKAYWGADFHNIRKHLNINNVRFYEDEETPNGCVRKFSARYAYQLEFLKNINFVAERYRNAHKTLGMDEWQPLQTGRISIGPNELNELKDRMAKTPAWAYKDTVYQNCACLSVKSGMRDYLKEGENTELGFDGTNLLRSVAFTNQKPLCKVNMEKALLEYPNSFQYPPYKFGMEFYRNNIQEREFNAWLCGMRDPGVYLISDNQNALMYPDRVDKDTLSSVSGVISYFRNGHGAYSLEGIGRKETLIADAGKTIPFVDYYEGRVPGVRQYCSYGDIYKLVMDRWVESIYKADKLDPSINGEITRENVPFLAGIIESDIMCSLLKRQSERRISRRDYYPSAEEISVIAKAFESGTRGFCRHVDIEVTEQQSVKQRSAENVFTDEVPLWLECGGR